MPWIQLAGAVLLVLGTAALLAFLRLAETLDAQAQAPLGAPAWRARRTPARVRQRASSTPGARDDEAYPRAA